MIELFNEDCFEGMKRIADKSVDLVITDPPFGCTDCEWDKKIDLLAFHQELKRICKEKALLISFSKQPFTNELMNAFKGCYKEIWYWKKHSSGGFLSANKTPLRTVEEIIIFKVNKNATNTLYNPQMIKLDKPKRKKGYKATEIYHSSWNPSNRKEICDYAYPKNLLDYYEPQKDKKHPCQKPLELVKYLLKTYSNEEMLILDPFAGSGVTGVACKECNRNFIGFELNKEYYEKAKNRIENTNSLILTN